MQQLTLSLGLLLSVLGLASYFGTGQESMTALIPTFFGIVFIVFAQLSKKETLKKHMMHGAAGLALLGALGAARGIPGLFDIIGGEIVERPLAVYAQVAMLLMCLVYLFKAVLSFRAARREGTV